MKPFQRIQAAWRVLTNAPSPRTNRRQFEAAKINRLNSSWSTMLLSSDQEVFRDIKKLRPRSRDLANNNDYIKRWLQMVVTNVIGPNGIQLQSKAKTSSGNLDKKAITLIEENWKDWGKIGNCDVTGKHSWRSIQALIAETVAKDGEVLVRKVRNYSNKYGFALQILETDWLDEQYNVDLGNGRCIRMGVELDEWRKPIAYHLFKQQPYDIYYQWPVGERYQRVPADEIIHLFIPLRPGQTRGIPWAHAAMMRLNMLGGYEEAELIAARLGAAKCGFFERADDGAGYEGEEEDDDGELITDAEPGVYTNLPVGVTFKPYDPQHPSGNFEAFMKVILRGVAAGLGVSYNSLANNLENVNFSSIRSGALEERDHWMIIQNWLSESLHDQIFPDWLEIGMLKGVIPLPFSRITDFLMTRWQPRRWPWVDPLKDIKASLEEVKMLGKSIGDHIRDQGRDPVEVFEDIAKTKEELESLGLGDWLKLVYNEKEPPDNAAASESES